MNDFKVGDWVRIGDTVQQVIEVNPENNYNITADMIETTDDYVSVGSVTKWQPQEGEWCWFEVTDFDTDTSTFLFGKYNYDNFFIVDFLDEQIEFISCEPFIGELPLFVKDR